MIQQLAGLLSVAMCFILVGSSYPIAQEAMNSIPTWTFTLITFIIGFLFLLPLSLKSEKTNWFAISKRDWLIVCVLSLLGAVLYTVFLLYGLPSTTAVTASVVTSASPAVVLLLSVVFFREKLKVNAVISVALAVISVIIMTLPSAQGASGNSMTGLVFLCLSTLANSLNIIIANKMAPGIKPMTMAAGVCLTGAIFSIPMSVHELQSFSLSQISGHDMGIMVYYGIFVWALPYFLFFKGINKISATSAGMCVALTPVASMLCAVIGFGQSISHTDLIATAVIILSVFASEMTFKKRANKALA